MPVTKDKVKQTATPTKAKATPPPPSEEPEGDEDSFANVFDKAKPQGQVDDGKYDAIIRELVLQDPNEKGRAVRIKYHIISDGEFQGQEIAQFYSIMTADKKAGPGLGFLKRDLSILGYPEVTLGDLKAIFENIVNNEELGCMITVKTNTTNQGIFTNAYLNGIMPDTEAVTEYRSNNPF